MYRYYTILFPFIMHACVHTHTRFENPAGSFVAKSSTADWLSFISRRVLGSRNSYENILSQYTLGREEALKKLKQRQKEDFITWIGHATFFIRLDQKYILTDPFFSNVAGKYSIGPRRYSTPNIGIEDLPKLDVLICTHNHYDHLDIKSLCTIRKKFGNKVQVFCPIGLSEYFQQCGFTAIREMNWNQQANVGKNLEIYCLPAIHNSGRSFFDKNKTLWCGFGLKTKSFCIYFAGDTAYHSKVFKEMRSTLKQCDVAILGIGAYEPETLLTQYHTNPEQAVQIALDIGAKNIVGMHWGMLNLSDEPVDEPIKRFCKAAESFGFSSNNIWRIKVGETVSLEK